MRGFDVIVVGQGYTGLKAAKFAVERGLNTAATERMFPGGLIMSINHLAPVPEGEEPSGPEVTGGLAMENMDAGVTSIEGAVTALSPGDGGWLVETDGGTFRAANVIVASGARLRKLGVPGEEEYAGRGVSECADCDGPLYMGKEAVIVGGGDSAFQEAVALTQYASKVTIVMRGAAPRAQAELVEAVANQPSIVVLPNAEVTEVLGDAGGVTAVRLTGAGAPGDTLPCAVLFAFVGLAPDVDFVPAEVERDAGGAIVTDDRLATALPGLWVVGAARSGYGGLMSHASEEAAKVVAAL